MTIKELALAKCPPLKSTNPKNRSRAMARFFGYQQGALDALKEIETRIEMGRHSSMQTSESILASVEMTKYIRSITATGPSTTALWGSVVLRKWS